MKLINTLTLMVCAWMLPGSYIFAQTTGAPGPAALKFGLYIHYGITTYAYPGERGQVPLERFVPTAPDVNGWVQAAKDAGMTFAILTAKHECGFCLWDSANYSYDVAQTQFKGDIIGDFVTACNAKGILPGLHYSIPDSLNDDGVLRYRGPVSAAYFELIKKHLTELNTRYPGVRLLALDGSGRLSADQFQEVSHLVKQLNPACLMLNDSGQEDRGPDYAVSSVINRGWFWRPNAQLVPASILAGNDRRAQANGRMFILSVGPDPSGRLPAEQATALMRVRELLDQADAPVTTASLKRGLILHYDFDQEPANGIVQDASGHGNDGGAVSVQWVADGHRGGSVQFGKDYSYISVQNNNSLNPPQFTLAAWIKTSYTDAIWRRIFDKGSGIGYVLSMCGDSKAGKSWQGQFDLEVSKQWAASRVNVADGNWHQVLGTYDGTGLQLYVDGQPIDWPRYELGQPAQTRYNLTIGANRSNPQPEEVGPSFNGLMDDVMMYERALTPKEIKFLYDAQKTPADMALVIPAIPSRTEPASSAPTPSKPAASERLKQLKDLYQQGLITKDQYDQKVKEVMDSL